MSILFFFCAACAGAVETPPAQSGASAAPRSPSPSPSPSPWPSPAFAVNPVSAFFAAYRSHTDIPHAQYRNRLFEAASIEAMESLMAFDRHFRSVMLPSVSVGRLSSSGANYADSLLGAAKGSGMMRMEEENAGESEEGNGNGAENASYVFSFSYDGGLFMQGYLRNGELRYTLHNAQTIESVQVETDVETGEAYEFVTTETSYGDAHALCILRLAEDGSCQSVYADAGHASLMQSDSGSVSFFKRPLEDNTSFLLEACSFEDIERFVRHAQLPAGSFTAGQP